MSFDLLIDKIRETDNPTVVGLDPKLDYVPDYIKNESFAQFGKNLEGAADAILKFNKGLIDALCDIVPAVKPQCAYYEMYGWAGVRALSETISYAKSKNMYVIVDGKRNDIGNTMKAYAAAYLGETKLDDENFETAFGADALTVNGYLGTDCIDPLINICNKLDKGIFVLAKTSNPSSGELQDKFIDGVAVYELMGKMCEDWGKQITGRYGYSGVGAVVGATYPHQLSSLRNSLSHTFFLVPGYGAQGGSGQDVAGAFDSEGLGAIVNSSRGIMLSYRNSGYDEKDYAVASRNEAIRMRDELRTCIKEKANNE